VPVKKVEDILCNIQRFTCAFWQIIWIPNILVSYSEDGHESDCNMLVMNSMW